MSYSIYLSFNNEAEVLQLPVNPSAIEISESGNSKTYDISVLGEVNVIKNPKLTEIGLESIFPATRYPFVVSETLLGPLQYIQMIKKWMESKRPNRFVFTGSTVDINMFISIEKFSWKEVGGAVGDIEYQLSLKKYVFYAAKKVIIEPPSTNQVAVAVQQPAPRPDNREQPKTYKLVAGDSLWAVAQKFLGNGARYKEIQKLNGITDSQLKKLPIGLELKLPVQNGGGSMYA